MSCEAPINVPPDVDALTCEFCGTNFIVKRGDGYVTVKVSEDVKRAIRESSKATQLELKRIQLQQELSSLRIQILGIQTEIRNLEQEKESWEKKKRLQELSKQKDELTKRVQSIQNLLRDPAFSVEDEIASVPETTKKESVENVTANAPETEEKQSNTETGCLIAGLLTFLLVDACCLAIIVIPHGNTLLVNSPDRTNSVVPFALIVAFIGFAAGIVAFYFHAYPESWLWKSIKQKFFGKTWRKIEKTGAHPNKVGYC